MRKAAVKRKTAETDIALELCLDGTGTADIDTGVGFLDHMLTLTAKHGRLDLSVRCAGDTRVDDHHSTEDIGIALGSAFREALGDKRGIRRYGSMILPMDEALVLCAVDLSGRSLLRYSLNTHHILEAAFKGFGRALREAVAADPDAAGEIPSTKGTLE